MIIRRQILPQNPAEDGEEISIDFERLGTIARKKTGVLAGAALLGFGLGLAYPLYKFSKPVETRLKTDILFVGSAGATGATGVTGMIGMTGVKEIDAVLSTFDPQINLQDIIQRWPVWSLLEKVLDQSGLKRIDSRTKVGFPGDPDRSKKVPIKFLVQDSSGRQHELLLDLQSRRGSPVQMIIQGSFPQEKLKTIGANLLRVFNNVWSQQALDLAQTQAAYAEKVRTQLDKKPAREIENDSRFAQLIQIPADFSLLSKNHRIHLIDQFLDKLKNWPPELIFAYNGKQTWEKMLPSRALWVLPFVIGAGFFLGKLIYLNFFGPVAEKVLGENDLAEVHPAASIYPTKMGVNKLINLLAASFAHAGQKKSGKLAAFVPESESGLMEIIRSAVERSGHSFAKGGSDKAEVCLFPTDEPSGQIARLPSQGFVRILLTAKKAESLKSRLKLCQAEADLAGIPIADVVLLED